jgi:restriction system protein
MFKANLTMMTAERKHEELLRLVEQRRSERLSPHFNLHDFHGGFYDCPHVSPWSISACNVDAELMLIGQDWVSSNILEREPDELRRKLGQDPSSSTNRNLGEFLQRMGTEFSRTYATNLFPFIKQGGKSAHIRFTDLVRCAEAYALPQIKIVSPRMVICLGRATFNAVRHAAGYRRLQWSEAGSPGAHTCIGSAEVYGLPHPGRQGTNNAGGKDVVGPSWERLGKRLAEMRAAIEPYDPSDKFVWKDDAGLIFLPRDAPMPPDPLKPQLDRLRERKRRKRHNQQKKPALRR